MGETGDRRGGGQGERGTGGGVGGGVRESGRAGEGEERGGKVEQEMCI
jgi:hypothetical protein